MNEGIEGALKRYDRELPSAIEFAKLAAALSKEHDHPTEALERASQFYLAASEFVEKFNQGTPEQRAILSGERFLATQARQLRQAAKWGVQVNLPDRFPAS